MDSLTRSRIKKWVIALAIIVILVVSFMAFVISDFRSASFDASVRMGLSDIIKKRLLTDGAMDGVISVPIDPSAWGSGTNAEMFAESINQLQPGDYRYFVYLDGDDQKFIVINSEPQLISSGFVPKRLITE